MMEPNRYFPAIFIAGIIAICVNIAVFVVILAEIAEHQKAHGFSMTEQMQKDEATVYTCRQFAINSTLCNTVYGNIETGEIH